MNKISQNKYHEFAMRLKILMLEQGIKTPALAKKIKCSVATINLWRSGHALPSPKNTEKIADALNSSSCFLLFGHTDGAPKENRNASKNIFSNGKTRQDKAAKKDKIKSAINEHIKKLIDEADQKPLALEHLFMELNIRLPQGIYSTRAF